jgi:hypothetical protein
MQSSRICLANSGIRNRRIPGYPALAGMGFSNIDLVAYCNLRRDYAERSATGGRAAVRPQ